MAGSMATSLPLLLLSLFDLSNLEKDYLSVQHNYYGITPGLC